MKRLSTFHFETLLWIARLGTFRAAAERLNTSQPAISARIHELEQRLGVAIFRREGRRMVLTSRGQQLVREIEPHLAGLQRAMLDVGDASQVSGTALIDAGEIAAASCLPGFVQAIEREMPSVTLEIELDLTARMLHRLLEGKRDLVLLAGPVSTPNIRTAPIGSVELIWLASAVTAAQPLTEPLPIWTVGEHSPLHAAMLRSLSILGIGSVAINRCNNVRTIIDIVIGGRGVALFPETMVRKAMDECSLVEVFPRPDLHIEFQIAIRADESDPLILKLFEHGKGMRIETLTAAPS